MTKEADKRQLGLERAVDGWITPDRRSASPAEASSAARLGLLDRLARGCLRARSRARGAWPEPALAREMLELRELSLRWRAARGGSG